MKIFYYYDEPYEDMKENFENSFKDDFKKNAIKLETFKTSVAGKALKNPLSNGKKRTTGGGLDSWLFKTGMVVDAISNNFGEVIVISDIDIVFYDKCIPTIHDTIKDVDISFQRENSRRNVNIGFIAIRCNDTTLNFWKTVRQVCMDTNMWDQKVVNQLLIKDKYPIKWNRFPSRIWCRTLGFYWPNGIPTCAKRTQQKLPKNIILHHANGAGTKAKKYNQFKKVASLLKKRKDEK